MMRVGIDIGFKSFSAQRVNLFYGQKVANLVGGVVFSWDADLYERARKYVGMHFLVVKFVGGAIVGDLRRKNGLR